jgi:hypothetical protein
MDFLDRIGQLNIPNGLAGPQGPAGSNGAGWTSGSTNPTTAPPASIKFYLNTVSGQIFEWNGTAWVSSITTIKGTNGNVWFSGAVPPVTVPGAVANDYYLDTVLGDVYKLVGVSWVLQLRIKGQNGAPGVNGTGLLASNVSIPVSVFSANSVSGVDLNCTLSFNGQQAFPTIGSVVKSTIFMSSSYSTSSVTPRASGGLIYMAPRVLNNTTGQFSDLLVPTRDADQNIDNKPLLPPSVDNNNYTHGRNSSGDYSISGTQLPEQGDPSRRFPSAHTKITTTLIRNGSSSVAASVEYTTTTRYATYTAVYPTFISSLTLGFGSSDTITIELRGTIFATSSYPVVVAPAYHIIEKSIL